MTQSSRPPHPPAAGKVALNYAPRPAQLRRRLVRWSITLAVLVGISIAAWLYGPHAWLFARQYYWQRQCMKFSPPADTVVYERLPAGATMPVTVAPYLDGPQVPSVNLSKFIHGTSEVEAFRVPICWARFMQITSNGTSGHNPAVVFCHQRTSPGGHNRLVMVEFDAFEPGDLLADAMRGSAYASVGWNGSRPMNSRRQGTAFNGRALALPRRIFAGQPDPADASHFSIEYEWPTGLRGFVDGYLLDDDSIKCKIRPGPGDIDAERGAVYHGR